MALTPFSFVPNTLPTHQIADAVELPNANQNLTYGLVARGTSGRQKAWRPTIIETRANGHKMLIGEVRASVRDGHQGYLVGVQLPKTTAYSPPYCQCFVPTQDLAIKVMRLIVEETYL